MKTTKKEMMIPMGTSALVIAIALQRFVPIELPILSFIEGLLMGLSITLNLAGLYFTSKTNQH
jgi:hypothetical protein